MDTDQVENEFVWDIHPAREHPHRAAAILVIIIAAGIGSSWYMEQLYFGIFAVVVLFLGMGSFFFPSRYRVNPRGVVRKIAGMKWQKEWSYFARFNVLPDGLFLSPQPKPSALDNFRGWFLPTTDEKTKKFVVKMMEEQLARADATQG